MPVNSTHPDYDATIAAWERARDVIAGEDAVKQRGERYLPRLAEQTDEEYKAYKLRASFYSATGRTLEALVGLILRSDYVLNIPAENSPIGKVLRAFVKDVDLGGMTLSAYLKRLVTEVVAVGRCGTLIDWEGDHASRVGLVFYAAEQITNWRFERVNGRRVLSLLVLKEKVESGKLKAEIEDEFDSVAVDQLRVLRLTASGVVVELWQEREGAANGKKEWVLVSSTVPLRAGAPLDAIPFVFHEPQRSDGRVAPLPLAHLIAINLDHYRLDADYKHGLHFTALPTAYVVGMEGKSSLRIGSSTAWMLEGKDARVGFLEFTGQGLTSFERAMQHDEQLMAILGTRMLEGQKRAYESAKSLELRQTAEESALVTIALSLSESMTEVLRWIAWWSSVAASVSELGEESFRLSVNHDFNAASLMAPEMLALVQAWQAGAISRDTLLDVFRRGELIPVGRTNEEEKRLSAPIQNDQLKIQNGAGTSNNQHRTSNIQ